MDYGDFMVVEMRLCRFQGRLKAIHKRLQDVLEVFGRSLAFQRDFGNFRNFSIV